MGGRFLRFRLDIMQFHAYLQGLPQTPCSPPVGAAHVMQLRWSLKTPSSGEGGGGRVFGVFNTPFGQRGGACLNTPFIRL